MLGTSAKRLENPTTIFARKREFGFVCPAFTMGLSGDGFLLPRGPARVLEAMSLLPRSRRHWPRVVPLRSRDGDGDGTREREGMVLILRRGLGY